MTPVGANKSVPIDVRVIAATNLSPAALGDESRFRPDLLFRLNTVELALPSLARRDGDAVLLARHFLERFAARHGRRPLPLTDEAAAWIAAHSWQDDVRGLRQAMERAVLLGENEAHDVGDFARDGSDVAVPAPSGSDLNLERSERVLVEAALKRHILCQIARC